MTRPLAPCAHCLNKGLIAVRYHSGERPDVAICECLAGEVWRDRGETAIREAMHLAPEQQVTDLSAVELGAAQQTSTADLEALVRTQGRKAKL